MAHFDSKYFEDLMDSLSNDIATSKSARVIVPVCHIYLEHMMDLLLTKKYSEHEKFLSNSDNGFKKKLDKLNELKLLSDDEFHDLDKLNKIRNRFTHEFKPDLEQIHQWALSLKFHVFNEKRNPVEVILYDIIEIMTKLEQKILN